MLKKWTCLVAILALPWMSQGCIVLVTPGLVSRGAGFQETQVEPGASWLTANKILVIDVDGAIGAEASKGFLSSQPSTLSDMTEKLRKAAKDKSVKGIVLRINSPGGEVTACDVISREIKRYKEETHNPVVACMMSVAASGGYYLSASCDAIVAHPTTVTGSIGVVMSLLNYKGAAEKIGLKSVTIKSGKVKDIGSPFREMTQEERDILQGIIDDMYGKFVDVVATGRKLDRAKVVEIADGRVYTADQALSAGLVDKIGYLDDAVSMVKKRAKVDDAKVILYNRGSDYRGSIYAQGGPISGDVNMVKVDLGALADRLQPGFYYMWIPGRE